MDEFEKMAREIVAKGFRQHLDEPSMRAGTFAVLITQALRQARQQGRVEGLREAGSIAGVLYGEIRPDVNEDIARACFDRAAQLEKESEDG